MHQFFLLPNASQLQARLSPVSSDCISYQLCQLPTYLLYLQTYIPTYFSNTPTYFFYTPTYLHTHLLTYLPYLHTYLTTYLLSYILTYLLTYIEHHTSITTLTERFIQNFVKMNRCITYLVYMPTLAHSSFQT